MTTPRSNSTLKKPPEDHGVGDVGDVQLVEAEQARIPGHFQRDQRDRVAIDLGAGDGDALVRFRHEGVEVRCAASA